MWRVGRSCARGAHLARYLVSKLITFQKEESEEEDEEEKEKEEEEEKKRKKKKKTKMVPGCQACDAWSRGGAGAKP
jgi:hypothetical protein